MFGNSILLYSLGQPGVHHPWVFVSPVLKLKTWSTRPGFLFLFWIHSCIFCGAEVGTQNLMNAMQILYHRLIYTRPILCLIHFIYTFNLISFNMCMYTCMYMYMCACNSTYIVVSVQLVGAGSSFTKWVVGLELRSSDLYLLSYLFGSHKQGSSYLARSPFSSLWFYKSPIQRLTSPI